MDVKMSDFGPNMRALIALFIGDEAIPKGGGMQDALEFFGNDEKRMIVIGSAIKKANALMESVKPFFNTNSDELIAGELVEKIKQQKRSGYRR